jgi:glycerophosphoryl diester phosphodiesterase
VTGTSILALPDGIPTVEVTGQWMTLDGTPATGAVTITPEPGRLVAPSLDLVIAGPIRVPLDSAGRVAVELPATDAPQLVPTPFAYLVRVEVGGTCRYDLTITAPAADGPVDLADHTPSGPPPEGGDAYVYSVNGKTGHVVIAVGDGAVATVNGRPPDAAGNVTLAPADVDAIPAAAAGAPGGVAQLGPDGRVPAAQLPPASGGGTVTSVAGVGPGPDGDVPLTAADVGADPAGAAAAAQAAAIAHADNLTAADVGADPAGSAAAAQAAAIAHADALTAADVGAVPAAAVGAPGGVAALGADGLVPAAQLPADIGEAGPQGPPGTDGREVQLQTSATHIQWRYAGETVWTDLVPLAELEGPAGADGAPGADGKSVELRATATHIQWRRVGDTVWIDLVALSAITGPEGPEGPEGPQGEPGAGVGNVLTVDDLTWPQTIAHRGGGFTAPENSYLAFDNCVDQGVTVAEIDVQLTSDGALVLMHDLSALRTTGVDTPIASMSLPAVRGLRVRPALFGFSNLDDFAVPTLEDMFRRYAAAPIVWLIEAKIDAASTTAQRTALGEAIVAEVVKHGMQQRVMVQGFQRECVLPAIGAGIPGGYLETAGATDPATLVAEGFAMYGMRSDATLARMQAAVSAGMRLLVYGTRPNSSSAILDMQTRTDVATLRAAVPQVSVISDDPAYVAPGWVRGRTALNGGNWGNGYTINVVDRYRGQMLPNGGPTSEWVPAYPLTGYTVYDQPRWRRIGGRVVWAGELDAASGSLSPANASSPNIINIPPNGRPESYFTVATRTYTGSGPKLGFVTLNPSGTLLVSGDGSSQTSYAATSTRMSLSALDYSGASTGLRQGLMIDRFNGGTSGNYGAVVIGEVSPVLSRTPGYTIEVDVDMMHYTHTTSSAQVQFALADDLGYNDDSRSVNCYNLLLRTSGTIELFRVTGTIAAPVKTSLGSQTSTAIPAGTFGIRLRIAVTATQITCTRLDTGATFTVTDSTFTGGYIGVGARNCQAAFSNMTVI